MAIDKQDQKVKELQLILDKSRCGGTQSESDLAVLSKWVNCNCALPPRLELQIKEILRKGNQRLEVFKQVVKIKQAERLSKLLHSSQVLEEQLYDPANIAEMKPFEQIQAMALLQKGIEQAKSFVYDESENVVDVIANDGNEGKPEKNFSPASREKIRRAVSRILTQKE